MDLTQGARAWKKHITDPIGQEEAAQGGLDSFRLDEDGWSSSQEIRKNSHFRTCFLQVGSNKTGWFFPAKEDLCDIYVAKTQVSDAEHDQASRSCGAQAQQDLEVMKGFSVSVDFQMQGAWC